MTNEERAREAATEIAKADPDWDTHAEIILTALNAATAELEAERGRLREAPAFVCGAIIAPNGSLRFIDVISDERYAWDYAFGFPDEEEIARCKKEGFRYQLMYAFTCDHRSALPELIARVERAEKERDRLRKAAKAVNDAWRGMPSSWSVYETTKHVVRALEPAVWKLQSTLNGDTPNV